MSGGREYNRGQDMVQKKAGHTQQQSYSIKETSAIRILYFEWQKKEENG